MARPLTLPLHNVINIKKKHLIFAASLSSSCYFPLLDLFVYLTNRNQIRGRHNKYITSLIELQPDQIHMAVLFWYLVKIDAICTLPHSSVQ